MQTLQRGVRRMAIGTALLCVLNDLAEACDRAEYEAWYQRDHLPDRLSVPGFGHARRYRRLHGPQQDYLNPRVAHLIHRMAGIR